MKEKKEFSYEFHNKLLLIFILTYIVLIFISGKFSENADLLSLLISILFLASGFCLFILILSSFFWSVGKEIPAIAKDVKKKYLTIIMSFINNIVIFLGSIFASAYIMLLLPFPDGFKENIFIPSLIIGIVISFIKWILDLEIIKIFFLENPICPKCNELGFIEKNEIVNFDILKKSSSSSYEVLGYEFNHSQKESFHYEIRYDYQCKNCGSKWKKLISITTSRNNYYEKNENGESIIKFNID